MKNNTMKNAVLIATWCILIFGCGESLKNDASEEKPRIRVTSVRYEKVSFPVHSSGLVVPSKEIKLSFKTGGIISKLYANDGSKVRKGTLLASLDLSEIEAQVKQAKNGFDKTMRDFSRVKNLYADSVATLEQLQNAETAMNVARTMLDVATFNHEYSRIFAPDDGVILKRLVESHEVIGPGYPVFIFGTTGMYWKIRTGLSDRDFVKIALGDSATVTFDAYPGEKFKALVTQVGEAANPMTGTYEIELDLLPVEKRLASGFIANLEIIPSRSGSFSRIPVEALVEAEGKTGYVFAVTDSSTVNKIKVEIEDIHDAWAAVSSGLEGVREVATEGSAYLEDGAKVTVVK